MFFLLKIYNLRLFYDKIILRKKVLLFRIMELLWRSTRSLHPLITKRAARNFTSAWDLCIQDSYGTAGRIPLFPGHIGTSYRRIGLSKFSGSVADETRVLYF